MIVNHTINKVINSTEENTESLLDLTADSVSPENLLLNKTAHNSEGEGIVGEMPEGGASDYDELENRPQINSNLLTGNKTGGQLGLQNRVLASTLNIGGQTIDNVEGALSALNESKSDLVNGKVPVNELPVYQPVIGSIQSIGGIVPPSSSGDEDKYLRSDGKWAKPSGGGGGVSDYDDLSNRPKVNGTTLSGDKTGTQLGLQNIVLSSALSIGGQTVTEVEEALQALSEKIGGTDNYPDLQNKPQVNGNTLVGNKTGSQLGLQNVVLASALTIGGQEITEVEPALRALNEKGGGHTILDEDGNTYPQRSKLQFEGCEITDDADNGVTVVKCEGGGTVIVEVPTVTNTELIYDGTTKSPTITRDTAHTTITGTTEATEFGSYSFTISLPNPSYMWSDNTVAPKTYTWGVGYDGSTITPTNDIQTWLKCAMITDKNYTTLNEVLSDQTTLAKLVSNDNACDYLVRSTSWVSSITTSEIGMNAIGASDYCADTLLADSTWRTAICDSTYFENVLNTKVPTMTSNTTPSGTVIYSGYGNSAYYPWYAFNGDSHRWRAAADTNANYIGYTFTSPVSIKKVYAHFVSSIQNFARTFSIQASNDNFVNDVHNLGTIQKTATGENEAYVNINNNDEYSSYRIFCNDVLYHDSLWGQDVETVQFYGRTEAAGVQDWLKAGGITDKNYITLAEVLADSTTLAVLMLSHNAVDYLVTATAWADTICANQTAMTDIGASDYCADTLLADSTWRTAICDSTYFENVLTTKVPVMTSATTPTGEVITSGSTSGYPVWQAFDGKDSTQGAVSSATGYSGYKFTTPVKIFKVYFDETPNKRLQKFKIQGSNTGASNDWHDISSTINVPSTHIITTNFQCATSYQYIRLLQVSASQGNCSYCTMQFYGRASS